MIRINRWFRWPFGAFTQFRWLFWVSTQFRSFWGLALKFRWLFGGHSTSALNSNQLITHHEILSRPNPWPERLSRNWLKINSWLKWIPQLLIQIDSWLKRKAFDSELARDWTLSHTQVWFQVKNTHSKENCYGENHLIPTWILRFNSHSTDVFLFTLEN